MAYYLAKNILYLGCNKLHVRVVSYGSESPKFPGVNLILYLWEDATKHASREVYTIRLRRHDRFKGSLQTLFFFVSQFHWPHDISMPRTINLTVVFFDY